MKSQARRKRKATQNASRDVPAAILMATEQLLKERRFDEINVNDILKAAKVSRASFYFYFENKYVVLGELLKRAVKQGLEAGQPWLEHDHKPQGQTLLALRQGIQDGARLWRKEAPILRAVVENWRSDPALSELWKELMQKFTDETVMRIKRDRDLGLAPDNTLDIDVLASSLTWLGEHLYYLAAIGQAPFDDEEKLVNALTEIWQAVVYKRGEP